MVSRFMAAPCHQNRLPAFCTRRNRGKNSARAAVYQIKGLLRTVQLCGSSLRLQKYRFRVMQVVKPVDLRNINRIRITEQMEISFMSRHVKRVKVRSAIGRELLIKVRKFLLSFVLCHILFPFITAVTAKVDIHHLPHCLVWLKHGNQPFHRFLRRRPARAEAHRTVCLVHLFPEAKRKLPGQPIDLRIRQYRKLLVRR